VRLNFCDLSQYSLLPDHVIRTLFDVKFIDVVIYCLLSPGLKVADILGPGFRRADKQFALPSMAADDCVYFYFDYDCRALKYLAPSAQSQIRYFDAYGRRIIRQMTATFSLVENMYTCAINVNYDVHIAAVAIRAVEKHRLWRTIEAVEASWKESKAALLDDTFAKLFVFGIDKLSRAKLEQVLRKGKNLLSMAAFRK
jgi:hypothetical protein